jgi:hypothetical protein
LYDRTVGTDDAILRRKRSALPGRQPAGARDLGKPISSRADRSRPRIRRQRLRITKLPKSLRLVGLF